MIFAAGILYLDPDGNALFLKRGPGGDHPGEWAFPGGQVEPGETALEAAEREAIEELGFLPDGRSDAAPFDESEHPRELSRRNDGEVDYTTFVQRVPKQFAPQVNGEHTGWAWAKTDAPPEPLHPGCRVALARITMDELGVARAMAAGDLVSPQRYENVRLFAVRITGTGTAYRKALDEYVYRRPENYLTEDFLARCNGLPLIYEHPRGNMLTSKDFAERIIGTIVLPYIKGDEVWGIAKVYDEQAGDLMAEGKLSTSPAVVFRDPSVNDKVTLDDGSTLLIEGKPSLLDHLAVCELGVWDKGGPPAGVDYGNSEGAMEENEMTPAADRAKKDAEESEEKKREEEREDRARKDAEAGEKLDKVLSALDAVCGRVDAVCERMDAYDKARKDAEEEERAKKATPEELAADKAKKDAEEEEKREEERKADRARKDAAEEEERAKIKADAVDTKRRMDAIERAMKDRSDADQAAFADAQSRADEIMSAFGNRAPRPLSGEDLVDYRRRLVGKLKDHSTAWKEIDLAQLPEPALAIAEKAIYADALIVAQNPPDLPDGQLREHTTVDPMTGLRTTNFYGKTTFFSQLKRPSRRVVGIGVRKEA